MQAFPISIFQRAKNKEAILSNLPAYHAFPPNLVLQRIRQPNISAKVTENVDRVKWTLSGDVDMPMSVIKTNGIVERVS